MTIPHWYNLDAVCPPAIRDRLAAAADELESLMAEVLRVADLADEALADYYSGRVRPPASDTETADLVGPEHGVALSDGMLALELELSGFYRLTSLLYLGARAFGEANEPHLDRSTRLEDRLWIDSENASQRDLLQRCGAQGSTINPTTQGAEHG